MILPKSLTTVTTFSKFLAGILFVLFPLIGFQYGMIYQKTTNAALCGVNNESEKHDVTPPTPTQSPIATPNKTGWSRYMSKDLDLYIDYPNNFWFGSDGSLEKKVDHPHRTSSWIFINGSPLSKAELDLLSVMSLGETKVINKEGDTIPK